MELLPDRAPTPSKGTRNMDAHRAYLRAATTGITGEDGLRECMAFYQHALALDPQFANAHGALARATVAAAELHPRAA